jgi:ABC-type dipeptide/oligopeptide/nickel transport system permease component
MKVYVVSRLGRLIPVCFLVVVFNFLLIHMAPGDPVQLLAGEAASPEYVARIRAEFGLDQPIHRQLLVYLGKVLQGDLGRSFQFRQPVASLIVSRIPATLLLMLTALVVAVIVGVGLGLLASGRPDSWVDQTARLVSLLGFSVPIFWLGQMLLLLFALWLAWLPVQGMRSLREPQTGLAGVLDVLRHLVLPAVSFAFYNIALFSRLTRGAMVTILQEDFIRTARAKGLNERRIFLGHALRNALLPLVTVIGANVGLLLVGSVLTETVFGWPGLGRLMYEALYARDYPVLMGLFLFVSVAVVLANLATDLSYARLDPRIRLG